MNPKQQLFVKNYLANGFKPGKAAFDAGYSPHTASIISQRLMKDPRVAEAIAEGKRQLFGNYDVTAERVVKELACLGFANMQDYMRVTDDGYAYVDLSDLTREQAAAIQQLDCETYTEQGENGREVKKIKIKLADKKAALELLGKHVGVFKEDGGNRSLQVRIMYDGNRNQTQVDVAVNK